MARVVSGAAGPLEARCRSGYQFCPGLGSLGSAGPMGAASQVDTHQHRAHQRPSGPQSGYTAASLRGVTDITWPLLGSMTTLSGFPDFKSVCWSFDKEGRWPPGGAGSAETEFTSTPVAIRVTPMIFILMPMRLTLSQGPTQGGAGEGHGERRHQGPVLPVRSFARGPESARRPGRKRAGRADRLRLPAAPLTGHCGR